MNGLEEHYRRGLSKLFSEREICDLIGCKKILKVYPTTGQKRAFLVEYENQTVIAKLVKSRDLRVQREIEIVTKNKIMNVPRIFEIKQIESKSGERYICIIEQFIPGEILTDIIKRGKISLHSGIKLLRTLLNIVVQLEEINVVHRDIKPDNIIYGSDGEYYLLDFGIARQLNKVSLTSTGASIGPHTPGYGAPELFEYRKRDIDSRTDLFSIGVVLFEAMTGQHPFILDNDIQNIWYRTKTITPQDFLIDGDTNRQLISFIQTLMQKHPTRRPPTAKKALEWLNVILPTLKLGGV